MAVQPRKTKDRPRIGTRLQVPRLHWFFMNTNVPACRIQSRVEEGEDGKPVVTWSTIDPGNQQGLIVFLQERSSEFPPNIVLTSVKRNVAFARELKERQ